MENLLSSGREVLLRSVGMSLHLLDSGSSSGNDLLRIPDGQNTRLSHDGLGPVGKVGEPSQALLDGARENSGVGERVDAQ